MLFSRKKSTQRAAVVRCGKDKSMFDLLHVTERQETFILEVVLCCRKESTTSFFDILLKDKKQINYDTSVSRKGFEMNTYRDHVVSDC